MTTEDTSGRTAAMMLGAIALVLVATCGQDAAAATPCPDGEPTKAETGKPSPCDGWTLSEADSLYFAGLKIELQDCRSQAKEAVKVADAKLVSKSAEVEAAKTRIQALETALDDALKIQPQPAEETPWHEHPAFVVIASVVVTGTVTALAVVLAYEVK